MVCALVVDGVFIFATCLFVLLSLTSVAVLHNLSTRSLLIAELPLVHIVMALETCLPQPVEELSVEFLLGSVALGPLKLVEVGLSRAGIGSGLDPPQVIQIRYLEAVCVAVVVVVGRVMVVILVDYNVVSPLQLLTCSL